MKKFYLIPILFSALVLGGCSDNLVSSIKDAIGENSNNSGVTGGESGGVAGGNSGNVGGTGDIGGDVPGGGTSGGGSGETGGGGSSMPEPEPELYPCLTAEELDSGSPAAAGSINIYPLVKLTGAEADECVYKYTPYGSCQSSDWYYADTVALQINEDTPTNSEFTSPADYYNNTTGYVVYVSRFNVKLETPYLSDDKLKTTYRPSSGASFKIPFWVGYNGVSRQIIRVNLSHSSLITIPAYPNLDTSKNYYAKIKMEDIPESGVHNVTSRFECLAVKK